MLRGTVILGVGGWFLLHRRRNAPWCFCLSPLGKETPNAGNNSRPRTGQGRISSARHFGEWLHYLQQGDQMREAAVDAEAICEAVRRPTMRFVDIKTEEQHPILSIHRTCDLAVRQRTQLAKPTSLHSFPAPPANGRSSSDCIAAHGPQEASLADLQIVGSDLIHRPRPDRES